MVIIPETTFRLDAQLLPLAGTSQADAWRGAYASVRLYKPVDATRISDYPGGAWYAIGDDVLTRHEYQSSYSWDRRRKMWNIGLYLLPVGTLLNVGVARERVFDARNAGGGVQAEMIDPCQLKLVSPYYYRSGWWSDSPGCA